MSQGVPSVYMYGRIWVMYCYCIVTLVGIHSHIDTVIDEYDSVTDYTVCSVDDLCW